MKKIIATEKVFGPLGDLKKIIYWYEDGSKFERIPGEKRVPEVTSDLLRYCIKQFEKKFQ